jgi:SecD/SecF fusion protein
VPAYAVATAGAPVDVEPGERRRGPVPALTSPQDPTQVSRDEFDEMVRNLGVEEAEAERARRPAAAAAGRPAGGRRARSRANGGRTGSGGSGPGTPPAAGDGDAGQGGGGKPGKKPRNRRHGRPR